MDGTLNEEMLNDSETTEVSVRNSIEIIEDYIRKEYLDRLTDMPIVNSDFCLPLEDDIIDNVRIYRIKELIYQKGESSDDKFTTVYNTLSAYNTSVFILIDSDGNHIDFYVGVRNNEKSNELKRSTVNLGDTVKNAIIGNFPGVDIENKDRNGIVELSKKILSKKNVASVSVVGSNKRESVSRNGLSEQGIEKLLLAMQGHRYIGVIIAENQDSHEILNLRKKYQELYTMISPLQKIQYSVTESSGYSKNMLFSEMNGKQKVAKIGETVASVSTKVGVPMMGMIGKIATFIESGAVLSNNKSVQVASSYENKEICDLLKQLDESIKRTEEFDSYGMWKVAGYFISDDMSVAEMAASNYRSLMSGDTTGREVSAVNSWNNRKSGVVNEMLGYISRFSHPKFCYGGTNTIITDATSWISGKELGLHLGFPRRTVPGLPVNEHAEFDKEVNRCSFFAEKKSLRPDEKMTLGKIYDLGRITDRIVELNNDSLKMHTFITGATGSGKSNAVYQMLCELKQDKIPFLVIEPAKGEYKDAFGSMSDVNVFSTNPNVAELININPFRFPETIHVLEHVDGLVEIFSACWPMYDAMPAFFKDAMLKSYEDVGWDLGSSLFDGDDVEYPDFEILAEKLDELIEESDYASDIKSNYRGALITRVKSLSVGLNKYIFTTEQTSYKRIFDENSIIDISRVKSTETKSLIMGVLVYILNEYRMDTKEKNNSSLRHVTVLEEAHNLLKNTSASESDLVRKSVEMLTQTIAEIRTYGEGFIIVDQSPSSVDLSAIKNTNTKIVLRTPEENDRKAVGKSIGLTENQVNEIAKLPSGVAVVYQNDWINPVLTVIDKAPVNDGVQYINDYCERIKPIKEARSELVAMLMCPWIKKDRMKKKNLIQDMGVLEIKRIQKRNIIKIINDYDFFEGKLMWRAEDIPRLQGYLKLILGISPKEFDKMLLWSADLFREDIRNRLVKFDDKDLEEICNVLTKE